MDPKDSIDSVEARIEKLRTIIEYHSQKYYINADSAKLSEPTGLAVYISGNLFFTDSGNHCIRKFFSFQNTKADIIINFSAGIGIWGRYSNGTWIKLHNLSPAIIATADLDETAARTTAS